MFFGHALRFLQRFEVEVLTVVFGVRIKLHVQL